MRWLPRSSATLLVGALILVGLLFVWGMSSHDSLGTPLAPATHLANVGANSAAEFLVSQSASTASPPPRRDCRVEYENPLSHAKVVARLRNESLMFLGDSLVRYQYINLAYYLTTGGKWASAHPANEKEKEFRGWDRFYRLTTQRLKYEVCDCHRAYFGNTSLVLWGNSRENRYYRNVALGVNMDYVMQYGTHATIIHKPEFLNASCDVNGCVQRGCQPGQCGERPPGSTFRPLSVRDLWEHEICRLKPTIVIMNSGRWNTLDSPKGLYALAKLTENVPKCSHRTRLFVWRRTLPSREMVKEVVSKLRHAQPSETDYTDVDESSDSSAASGGVETKTWYPREDRNIVRWMRSPLGVWHNFTVLDNLPYVWGLVHPRYRHSGHLDEVFADGTHFQPEIVAALNRNLLLNLFGCDLLDAGAAVPGS